MTPLDNLGINAGFLLTFCFYAGVIVVMMVLSMYMLGHLRRAAAHRDEVSATQRDVRRLLEENLVAHRETNELLRKLIAANQAKIQNH
jgi:hypothetical protein